MDFDYCGSLYRDNQASCVNTAKLQKRLVSLEQIFLGLRQVLGTGRNPFFSANPVKSYPAPGGSRRACPRRESSGRSPAGDKIGLEAHGGMTGKLVNLQYLIFRHPEEGKGGGVVFFRLFPSFRRNFGFF